MVSGNLVLGEYELRKSLSSIYAAMVRSSKNTDLFLNSDPADVRYEDAAGDHKTKLAMVDSCQWLDDVRLQCHERAFDAVLGCVRTTARYLKSIRSAKSTTSLVGWAFQKSGVIRGAYNSRIAVTMIVPELESCMSMRLDAGVLGEIGRGMYRVGSVTPMMLANRLHPTHATEISPVDSSLDLSSYDFLKVRLVDARSFTESVEMDRYCEVASMQSELAHHLGAPMTIAGILVEVDGIRATIRGFVGDDRIIVVHSASGHEYESLQRMRNVPGRFLVVEWYQPGGCGKVNERRPELLYFEKCSLQELQHDDLIGYVRLRGEADIEEVEHICGTSVPAAACLVNAGDVVRYVGRPLHADPVINAFSDAVCTIKKIWADYRRDGRLQVTETDMVSGEMAALAAIAARLDNSFGLKSVLSDTLARFDYSGDWPDELDGAENAISAQCARYLIRQGLLETEGGKMLVTDMGRKMLERVLKEEVDLYLLGRDYVYLPEITSSVPRSVIMRCLKDSSDFCEHKDASGKNKLLWIRRGASADAKIVECEQDLDRRRKEILNLLRTVNHQANSKFVCYELRGNVRWTDYTSVGLMMRQLAAAGNLEGSEDGWRYPMHRRIPDIMSSDKDGVWDIARVMTESKMPMVDEADVKLEVKRLETAGLIIALADGKWAWKRHDADQQRDYAVHVIQDRMLALIRTKKMGMDSKILLERVNRTMLDQFGNIPIDRHQLGRDAIQELKKRNLIYESDGVYRITDERRSGA